MYTKKSGVLLVLILIICGALAVGSDAGRIVWSSARGGDNKVNLWGIDPDGTNAAQITTTFHSAIFPSISPDGKRIAFTSNDGGTWRIYLIGSDGGGLIQFTHFSSAVPNWSSDGKRLVFNSDHDDEPKDTPDLWAMDIDGTNLTELVDNPPVADFNGQWSPDGKYLLFTSNRNGNYDLYRLNLSNGKLTNLTPVRSNEWNGRWSPDGTKILFNSDRYHQIDIFVMNADGTGVKRLTRSPAHDSEPAWSPDGSQIVFSSDRSGNSDLWIMNADGTGLRQLTDDPAVDKFPDWGASPTDS